MSAPTQRINLIDEYSADWPVWVDGEGQQDRDEWAIPDKLRERLVAWAKEFDEHYEVLVGWDSRDRLERHTTEGKALQAALQEALGQHYAVELRIISEP